MPPGGLARPLSDIELPPSISGLAGCPDGRLRGCPGRKPPDWCPGVCKDPNSPGWGPNLAKYPGMPQGSLGVRGCPGVCRDPKPPRVRPDFWGRPRAPCRDPEVGYGPKLPRGRRGHLKVPKPPGGCLGFRRDPKPPGRCPETGRDPASPNGCLEVGECSKVPRKDMGARRGPKLAKVHPGVCGGPTAPFRSQGVGLNLP